MANEALLMRVRRALQAVRLADGRDVVSAGAVDALSASVEGVVAISLDAAPLGSDGERIAAAVKSAASGVEGATRASVALTAHRMNPRSAQESPPRAGGHSNPLGLNPVGLPKSARLAEAANALAAVRKVLVVASGKGGVGKSTVAVNLAYAFSRAGFKVGILDADITGPSVPTLFGGDAPQSARDGKIAPVERSGVKAMSIGYLVDPGKAVAWRGPMVMGAVRQLMGDVDWGALDILIIDTPPGSSDAHLTLAQSGVVSGVVIVSTPQLIALADVRRGAALFRQVGAPIVGVIENMAWIETPAGPQRLFGEGGAEKLASEIGAPFLGRLPLWPDLASISDSGEPIDAAHPAARAFDALAAKIAAGLKVTP